MAAEAIFMNGHKKTRQILNLPGFFPSFRF
jgi:hypothetical protein